MMFASVVFIFLFLPLVVGINWLIQQRYRPYFVTLASIFFFATFSVTHAIFLLFYIFVIYLLSKATMRLRHQQRRRGAAILFWLSIVLAVATLCYAKWHEFFDRFSIGILEGYGITIPSPSALVVMAGISFIIFSTISYLVDIWRGDVSEEANYFKTVEYIFFFPKILSGPIVRYKDFTSGRVTSDDILFGTQRFVLGLGKKLFIADPLGVIVQNIFTASASGEAGAIAHWLGIIAYTAQIYIDFSAYSDMAIAVARMLGYPISENFNFPYKSVTISEFWRRWHISLGMWFRNYLYIPLGGNRTGNVYVNLFIVFMVTGIWHGATINFLLWGTVFGVVIVIERYFRLHPPSWTIPKPIRWFITFMIVVLDWVLFRAATMGDALRYYRGLVGLTPHDAVVHWTAQISTMEAIFVLVVMAVVLIMPFLKLHQWWGKPTPTAVGAGVQIVLTTLLFSVSFIRLMTTSVNSFLYFQF